MVIGFDGSRAFVKNRTGTENYSYQLLLNLAKIDTINTYLVYVRPRSEIRLEDWPANFKFRVINLPRLWTQGGLAIHTFTDSLDVLFIPAHTLPVIRNPFLKTVISVHDLGSEYLPAMHQLKQRLYLGFMTKIQLKGATKLIAVSLATKDDLIKRVGIRSSKIEVIYEAVDKIAFKPQKNDALRDKLKHYGLERAKYFFFVGTVQPRKNLVRLIDAFARLNDASLKLVIAGGKGWLSDEIYSEPDRLAIKNQVKFLGRVSDEDLPALFSGAIALTFPALFEGFGLPILEAFACHCPVITSNVSSMPEVAGNAAILVDPLNVSNIVDALKKIMDNQLREDLIKKGLAQLNKFSWEKSARETLKVLEGVVSGR